MSIDEHKKPRRGRPTVDSEQLRARLDRQLIERLDEWRLAQIDGPSRPEAIRRLLELGLKAMPGATAQEMVTCFIQTKQPDRARIVTDALEKMSAALGFGMRTATREGPVEEERAESERAVMPAITPAQLSAARALLGWSRDRLASFSGISTGWLGKFERGELKLEPAMLLAIRATFEAAGVEFVEQNGVGAEVRLRKGEPPS